MPFVGEIAGLATAVCWSFTSIIFAAASRRVGSLQVNLYRFPLVILLLTASYWLTSTTYQVDLTSVWWLAVSGVIGLALGDTFLFQAFVHIGARLSMLVMALAPGMAALLAYFFLDERINLLGVGGILLTTAGVAWVVAEKGPDKKGVNPGFNLRGLFLAFLGALGQAVGLIFAKKGLLLPIHPLLATLVRMSAATLLLWPVSLLLGRVRSPGIFLRDGIAARLMIAGVLLGPFAGVTLSLVAVKYTDTGIAATLMSTMPVIMLPMVVLIEKERLSWRAILGAVIAVTGIALLFLR